MNKKTKKEIKKLSKDLSAVRKENTKLARKLEKRIEAVERQAEADREEIQASQPHTRTEHQGPARNGDKEPAADDGRTPEAREVTDAAVRKAGELGVDLSEVRGTGSGGRALVKDVDRTAQEIQ